MIFKIRILFFDLIKKLHEIKVKKVINHRPIWIFRNFFIVRLCGNKIKPDRFGMKDCLLFKAENFFIFRMYQKTLGELRRR